MSSRKQIKNEFSKLADYFEQLGGHLDIEIVEDEEAWWFGARGGGRHKFEIHSAALEAIPMTVEFALTVAGGR